jgi:Na+/proline symporter
VSFGSISVIIFIGLIASLLLYVLPDLFWGQISMIFVGFAVFVTIAVFTIVSTTRRLIKPGFSKQVRRTVLLRQIRYILTITFVFVCFFITKSIQIDVKKMFWINFVGTLLLCSLGFILSLYRLSEPLVWKTLKDKLMFVLCCGKRQPEADSIEEADTLTTFLATSYNVELVYVILKGITSFSKEQHRIDQGSKKPGKSNIKRAVSNS